MIALEEHKDYDTAIEKGLLGLLLSDANAYQTLYGVLGVNSFYHTANKDVYAAIEAVWQQGYMIEALTVHRQLLSAGRATINGMPAFMYLGTLMDSVTARCTAYSTQWALMLKELAGRRELALWKQKPMRDGDVFEEMRSFHNLLTEVLTIRPGNDWQTPAQVARLFNDEREERLQTGIEMSTTLPTIDGINGGFRKGQLIVIGARSGMGKSAFATQVAMQAAIAGKPGGFISCEMSSASIFARMLSIHSGIIHDKVDREPLTPAEEKRMHHSMHTLSTLPIYFADRSGITIDDIRLKAQLLHERHAIKWLIVDYLQIIKETDRDRGRSREQAVAAISKGLKELAMQLHIPVIALCQLNRESDKRPNKRPTAADLRESSAIEHDADVIMLLHRDYHADIREDANGHSTREQADIIIPKWRNGTTTAIKIHFQPGLMKFSESG